VLPRKFFNLRSPGCPFLPFQGEIYASRTTKKVVCQNYQGVEENAASKTFEY
jgi:hypothetical protein